MRGLVHIGVIRVLELIQDYLGQESSQGSDRPALSKVLIISFETMQETLSPCKLATNPPDLLISIPKNKCTAHEFFIASELIEAGRGGRGERLRQLRYKFASVFSSVLGQTRYSAELPGIYFLNV